MVWGVCEYMGDQQNGFLFQDRFDDRGYAYMWKLTLDIRKVRLLSQPFYPHYLKS